jgi:hypothetical protein
LTGREIKVFPSEIINFQDLNLIDNWWDGYDLNKIDLSNNLIEEIPVEIGAQEVSIFSHVYCAMYVVLRVLHSQSNFSF